MRVFSSLMKCHVLGTNTYARYTKLCTLDVSTTHISSVQFAYFFFSMISAISFIHFKLLLSNVYFLWLSDLINHPIITLHLARQQLCYTQSVATKHVSHQSTIKNTANFAHVLSKLCNRLYTLKISRPHKPTKYYILLCEAQDIGTVYFTFS